MKNAWSSLLLLFYLKAATSKISCNKADNCLCLPGQEFEFQCPEDDQHNEFIIHVVEEQRILIDCKFNLTRFNINLLPNITLDRIDKFEIRFCPLPQNGFKEIIDWFSLKRVKTFLYRSASPSATRTTWTKALFEGLDFVESLVLDNNELVDLEEDVFSGTPNLLSLDLRANRLKMNPSLFKYTPLLTSLDLSENQIDRIPETLFDNLEKLETLYLWSNNLTQIDDLVFSRLVSLQFLEMSSNKITKFSENALKNLSNLHRINLSRNRLETLPEDIFAHNKKMEWIFIRSNNNFEVPRHIFSNLSHLQAVDLSFCGISDIPDDVFQNLSNIEVIRLDNNKLEVIPENLFRGLANLEKIYLNNNNIAEIDGAFASLSKLKNLYLQNNKIVEISENVFKDLKSLEEIDLSSNEIRTIDDRAFYYSDQNLKIIDISHNKYSGNPDSQFKLFENMIEVEKIDLSHNYIEYINDVINMYNKVKLTSLNLSHNRMTYIDVKDLQPLAKKLTVNLEYNNITTVNFSYVDQITDNVQDAFSNTNQPFSIVYLAYNPIECDCTNYDLVRYFRDEMRPQVKVMFDIRSENLNCASPPELKDFKIENLPPSLVLCSFERMALGNTCPRDCSCSWRPLDKSVIIDCSNKNLTEFPLLHLSKITHLGFNQTEMHLEGNSLVVGPDENLTDYENITKLYLSHNQIQTVAWIPPNLEVLHLDHNQLKRLRYEVFETMNKSSLHNLTLDSNPWHCDCNAVNFSNFLRQHTKTVYAEDILCANGSRRLIDLNRHDLCSELEIIYVVLIVLLILFAITIFLTVFCCYQQEIKVWLYAHNLCLWWVTEEELDKDKIYDAFISYSHKDEDFVVENLLPVLEGGPSPYKLCLHYRNWVPGEFITTQVTNSVLESRRTLVVLSKNFLESVWGKMEFRTAHTQAMTEGRARVIIVLYGDVDMEKLDDELKTYLRTNTYVKWGDPYFWNKLKYALPHSKRHDSYNNRKLANVMSVIDEKFNLVTPVTHNPGSTPPVLALDAKKNPLNFITNQEIDDTPPAEAGNLLVSK